MALSSCDLCRKSFDEAALTPVKHKKFCSGTLPFPPFLVFFAFIFQIILFFSHSLIISIYCVAIARIQREETFLDLYVRNWFVFGWFIPFPPLFTLNICNILLVECFGKYKAAAEKRKSLQPSEPLNPFDDQPGTLPSSSSSLLPPSSFFSLFFYIFNYCFNFHFLSIQLRYRRCDSTWSSWQSHLWYTFFFSPLLSEGLRIWARKFSFFFSL